MSFKIFNEKSIWLIRHGDKDWTKKTYYMDTFDEKNYDWSLSERGAVQSRRIATVLNKQYFIFLILENQYCTVGMREFVKRCNMKGNPLILKTDSLANT